MAITTDYALRDSAPAQAAARASSVANGDFDTFLKMLTTQIANQDPLNPMEGSDFAVQLATFSGVEQQARTNQLIEALASRMGVSGLSQLSGWIGREARSTAPAWFGERPLTLEVQPDDGADQVVLVALDSQGRTVTRDEIGPGAGQVDWFGRDETGAKLPDGAYGFAVESWREGVLIVTRPAQAYARVSEARLVAGEAVLVLEGGAEIPLAEVTALRDPPG